MPRFLTRFCATEFLLSLTNKKFFAKNQFGFLEGKSTPDALEQPTTLVYGKINNDKKVIATLIDLKKAFDTVRYKILLDKIDEAGIQGISRKLIHSYLQGRKCQSKMNNVKSSERNIGIGVLQGNLLGQHSFL